MEEVIARLIAAVDASGMKQNHLGRVTGLGKTKVNKILNRKQEPTISDFIAIARAINVDPGRLFSDGELVVDLETLRDAHAASQRLQKILEGWLPSAKPVPPAAAARATLAKAPRPHEGPSVRAAANPNATFVVELELERKQIPRRFWNRGAQIIARADGDSMDGGPDPIPDGADVYLKPTRSPRTAANKVALCRVDDGLFLKRFEKSGRTIRLVSTNDPQVMELDARTANIEIYGILVDHTP
jgi:transcriptional regulator with XRE-family HTH domain